MQCQNCGLPLDPQQVAQTGRCPRCGNPVALPQQGYTPAQPAFQSGPPAGAGAADDESPTIRVRPQAPAPAVPPAPQPSPIDPYAATQRGAQPTPAASSSPYGPPPGAASGPSAQPPASNPSPTDPYVPSAAGFAPPPTDAYVPSAAGFAPPPPPQQSFGAPPPYGGPPQQPFSGPPQQSFGAPPPGGFSGPGQPPPPYGAPPGGFSGPGQPPPFGAPQGGFPGQPMQGFPGGPMAPAPQPKKSRTGLIVGILIAVLIIGGLGSVAALGFAGKGPLKSLGSTPIPAATATPKATATPQPTATPSIPAGFQAFTSSDNSFSIAYPADWQKSDPSEGTGAQFAGPNNQAFIVLNGGTGQGDVATNEAAFCRSVGGPASTPTTVTIGGQSWTQVECDNGDGSRHAVVDAITYKDNLFLIAYGSDANSFAQDRTSFYTPMEQSFQFLI